jgi:Protein of unknown function (DUF2971)
VARLSHYTSLAGLEGIAQSKSLWATDFLDLNDKTEMLFGYVELAKSALLEAYAECKRLMKPGEGGVLDLDAAGEAILDFHRQSFARNPLLEHLYVTSFARARNADQEHRGMLTLWSRYTQNRGYCLQFEEDEIRQLIKMDSERRVYAFIELAEVSYGVDQNDPEYLALRYQQSLRYLGEVHREKRSLGVNPRFDEWWSLEELAIRSLKFVCRHKDPFFEDEREVRIMAVPAKRVLARPFSLGPRTKRVHVTPKPHISLGADWRSAIEPVRIIIGRDAPKDIDHVLALFTRKVEVVHPTFPIVGA